MLAFTNQSLKQSKNATMIQFKYVWTNYESDLESLQSANCKLNTIQKVENWKSWQHILYIEQVSDITNIQKSKVFKILINPKIFSNNF